MLYDHISFHLSEDFPDDLPPIHAVHHIGFFLTWAITQKLHSHKLASLTDFHRLQSNEISGAQFILNCLNGGIDDMCFNELGNRFVQFYYADEEDGYGRFIDDYFITLNLSNNNDFYRVDNTPTNQAKLHAVFQTAFQQWYDSLKS